MKPTLKTRIRISVIRKMGIISGLCFLLTLGFILVINLSDERDARAAASGDYRTKTAGDWSDPTVWEKFNGTSWENATSAPGSVDGIIEICNGHSITITSDITIDQLLVDESGMLTNNSATVSVVNGTGNDITINGYWNIRGQVLFANFSSMVIAGNVFCQTNGAVYLGTGSTVTVNSLGVFEKDAGIINEAAGHWIINNGGSYRHNQDGGVIPSATWNTGSNCEITGAVFNAPTNLGQQFSNFSWSCASMPGNISLNGELKTVNGDFRMTSTGGGSLKLSSSDTDAILTIGGNYYQDGGTVIMTTSGTTTVSVGGDVNMTEGMLIMSDGAAPNVGDGNATLNINGNLVMSTGTIDMSQYTGAAINKGIGTINLKGNLKNSSGMLTTTALGRGQGQFHFANTGPQTVIDMAAFGDKVDVFVDNGSILNLDTKILAGAGNFTLSAGASLIIGSPYGIRSTEWLGNVQMVGRRNYSVGASYTYKSTTAQVSGDGLPAFVNNLTVDNASGIVLTNSCTVTNTLTIAAGIINTGNDTLGLGVSNSNAGQLVRVSTSSCTVTGWFARWISSSAPAGYLFPLSCAGDYCAMNMAYSTPPTIAGKITMHFIPLNPGNTGLPVVEDENRINSAASDGYWNIDGTLVGGTYNVEAYAGNFHGLTNYSNLRLLYRQSASKSWTLAGSHSAGTLMASGPVIQRHTVDKTSGQFGIGEADAHEVIPDLPVESSSEDLLGVNILTNPFYENLTVHFHAIVPGRASVSLMNDVGQVVLRQAVQANRGTNTWEFVDNINLVVGIYFVTVEMYGIRVTKKVLKYS